MRNRDRRGNSFRFEPPKPLPEEPGPPEPWYILEQQRRRYYGEELSIEQICEEREEERRNARGC